MNRIQSLHGQESFASWSGGVEVSEASRPPLRKGTANALFGPLHYEPNYAYPLIVWLHGAGQDERQLKKVIPQISMRNYAAVAPRGLTIVGDPDAATSWSTNGTEVVFSDQQVFDCIRLATEKYNIAAHRIFLVGADRGGTMAFRIAMQHPAHFAGVISLGGPFPSGRVPLVQLPAIRKLPVLLSCNRASDRYESQQVCDNLRLFHTAGMSVTLREYPGGDELTPLMLADVDRWIMEQIAGETGAR